MCMHRVSLYVRVLKNRDTVLRCIGTSVSDVRSFDDYRIPFHLYEVAGRKRRDRKGMKRCRKLQEGVEI